MGIKLKNSGENFAFHCPGCKQIHTVGRSWAFNGDHEKPTFTPSVLVRSGCHAPHHNPGDNCWCTYNASRPPEERSSFSCMTCHSFITDGKIQFLGDCTHELAGKTVDMLDIEEM